MSTTDPVSVAVTLSLQGVNQNAVFLTPQQSRVYSLVVSGWTNREVGRLMGIQEKTVKCHVTHLLKKVNLRTRAQLIVAHYTHTIIVIEDV